MAATISRQGSPTTTFRSKILEVLAATTLLATTSRAQSNCRPLRGADVLWSRPELRFLLIGEIHGTNESPEIFLDLVCAASFTKRTVVIGIERNVREQAAIDVCMAPGEHETAKKALLAEQGWRILDGRSSQAILRLLESLRDLQHRRLISRAIAFDSGRDQNTPRQREQSMAETLKKANIGPNVVVIALTGNLHASEKLLDGFGSHPWMAMHLPADQTLSLFITDRGGEAWNQQGGECGPHRHNSSGSDRRGVILSSNAAPIGGFDGVLSTGLAATASPPAIALSRGNSPRSCVH